MLLVQAGNVTFCSSQGLHDTAAREGVQVLRFGLLAVERKHLQSAVCGQRKQAGLMQAVSDVARLCVLSLTGPLL